MLVGRWCLLLDQIHPGLVDSEASLPFTPLHRKDQNWQNSSTLTKEPNPLFIMLLLLILITSAIKEMVITRVPTHPAAGGSTYHIMQSRSCISIAATIQYKHKRCPHYGAPVWGKSVLGFCPKMQLRFINTNYQIPDFMQLLYYIP